MAVQFNAASSQYLAIASPRPETAGLTEYTLCCWVNVPRASSSSRWPVFFSEGGSTTQQRMGLQYVEDTFPYISSGMRAYNQGVFARAEWGVGPSGFSFNKTVFVAMHLYTVPGWGPYVSIRWMERTYSGIRWLNTARTTTSPTPGTPSLAAAIGGRGDGTQTLEGLVEDVRFYNRELSLSEEQQIGHRRGADLRAFMHPSLLFQWKLQGVGAVTTEADRKGGVIASAVNGPQYVNVGLVRRRRNRGG